MGFFWVSKAKLKLHGLILTVAVIGGCQQTQTLHFSAPPNGGALRSELYFDRDRYELEVHFPEGVVSRDERQVPIHVSRGTRQGGPFIAASVQGDSAFRVRNVTVSKSHTNTLLVRVFLQLNHFRLPSYPNDWPAEFNSSRLLSSSGRVLLGELKSRRGQSVRSSSFCNATLVSSNLVLTAEHCVKDALDCDRASFAVWASDGDGQGRFQLLACQEIVLNRRSADQSLIRLQSPISSKFNTSIARVIDGDYFFPNGTPLFIALDRTEWRQRSRILRADYHWEPRGGLGQKELLLSEVEASHFGFISRAMSAIDPIDPDREHRLNAYQLRDEGVPGMSGAGVYTLPGELMGVLSSSGGMITPLDPEIRLLISDAQK